MKTRNYIFIFLLLSSQLALYSYSQTSNVINIKFPFEEQSAFMPEDMLYAGGRLFVYSGNGIAVYNSNGSHLSTIPLPGQPTGQAYIEMAHLIETRTSYNTMAYDGQNTIYAVGPNYAVYSIDISNNYAQSQVIPPCYPGRFFNGSIKLMYEPISRWLFYAAQGPIDLVTDALPQYFEIYNTRTAPFQLIYSLPESEKMPDIYDFLVDLIIEDGYGSGYIYMSRKKKFQIFQCSFNPLNGNGTVTLSRSEFTETNKNGKLIMIEEPEPGGFKKIICLPMITRVTPSSFLYEIDAANPLNSEFISTPSTQLQSRNWIDALYESNTDQLLCAVKPNVISDPDFLVFDVSLNEADQLQLDYNPSSSLYTNNHFAADTSNFPVNIFKSGSSGMTYYLSRKNEFGKITYNNNNTPPFNWECISDQFNSYFERVVTNDFSTLYIMKMLGGGFSRLPTMSTMGNIYTGQCLNRGFFNESNKKIYFFNDNYIFPNNLFIMDPQNGSYTTSQINDIKFGDIIANPYTNEIIISKYEAENGSIRVYDNEINGFNEYSTGTNTRYCANMFIDPEGYLYVTTGMKAGEPLRIKIFNSRNNYTGPDPVFITMGFPVSQNPGHDAPAELIARFAYNPLDKFVYMFITNNPVPYLWEDIQNKHTLILKINKSGTFEIINDEYTSLAYDFILASNNKIYMAMENRLIQVDCQTNSCTTYLDNHDFIDIEYDALTNKIFALERDGGDVQNLYVIDLEDNSYYPVGLSDYRYVSSIKFIVESRTLVAYAPLIEDISLPEYNVKVLYIDVDNSFSISEESLELKSLSRRDYFNKLNIDIIHDFVNKKLFIPQGMHSKVSMINNIPEKLFLKKGWNWISFPRLERAGNDPVLSQPLLMNVSPFPENYLHMKHLIPFYQTTIEKNYDKPAWTGDLNSVQSTLGYKVETSNADLSNLPLVGTVLDPESLFDLYGRKYNWTGYFLPQAQSPFDAIGSEFLAKIDQITGQYWSCIKKDPSPTKATGGVWYCACQQGRVEIKYGEMVVISPSEDITNFHWQKAGQAPIEDPKAPSQSFQYIEKPEYDPIFILLDTMDLPQEIAAYAGDSCIGATIVLPSDTMALICAYSQGFEGQEITFEMIYSTKSGRPKCRDYYVVNRYTGIREQRRIIAGEKQPYFLVSLKQSEVSILNETPFDLEIIPNPAREEFMVAYLISYKTSIELQLFNSLGVPVQSWSQGIQPEGSYSIKINTSGFPSGCYYLRVKAENDIQLKKILIIH